MKRKILYLGWIGYNNFGDEWMWDMFRHMSNRYLEQDKYEIIPSLPGVDLNDIDPYDTVVLGGGSLLIPGYVDIMYNAAKKNKTTIIWGSGHDRLSRLMINDDRSFSPEPAADSAVYRAMLQEVIRSAAYCGIRGPWTHEYLSHSGAPMDRVSISGDPAMLAPLPSSVHQAERTDERWIGLNWGTSYNRIYGRNEAALEDELAHAAQRWIREGYKIYIYVVWGPDREAAKRLQQKIGFPEHVVFDPELHSLDAYLKLAQKFDFTVNFKLHANVLSAAAGIPFICLGYRFKSYDFVHSMNLPTIIIPTHAAHMETALLETASYIQNNRTDLIRNMQDLRERAELQLVTPFRDKLL
ncbi:polysaccharide pyruvyl transferase family protein [Paenibacillus alvei]|uniref:Polysaccharide pyruvyl transferase family protein n=1 Tax=Paenibacillus alvei TaxID=44250 RepID=A0ABT4GYF9_PAEAL|nr:polysaccharide pyruvyl transferase family protein [Paenibacillus alvei]MCY9761761.1 polysaccharide pyruvyl transferase family protein [Paenibacillus alvei]MCY9769803.1 polysaccharide pyruvyl transferase family protein [Paenibacillus alvei]